MAVRRSPMGSSAVPPHSVVPESCVLLPVGYVAGAKMISTTLFSWAMSINRFRKSLVSTLLVVLPEEIGPLVDWDDRQ